MIVIPDLLANAGGVTCSYFEQVQSNMNYFWELGEVLSKMDVKMTAAFYAVFDLSQKREVSMRDAALVELYSLGVHSARKAMIEPADRVVILGAGRLGGFGRDHCFVVDRDQGEVSINDPQFAIVSVYQTL